MSFKPIDPGRIELADPPEVAYWCQALKCDEAALRAAVGAVGTHVTAVREHLGNSMAAASKPDPKPK